MNQNNPVQFLINLLLKNPELLIIAFVILSSVFNFINQSGKRLRDAQREAQEAEERRRRGFMDQETDPATQSYDGYLKRTEQPDATLAPPPRPTVSPKSEQELKDLQADILEALGMGTQKTTQANTNPQEDLRRKLAEKMGRTTMQSAPQAPLGRGKPPPPAPAGMMRPPPRAENKPIETTIKPNIEVYLEQSKPERLEGDSRPDSLGHSKRQPHFDMPARRDPSLEGSLAFKNEGGSTVVALKGIQEVRGKEIVPTARTSNVPQTRFIDTREAVSGFVWNEILDRPRSMRRR